MYGITETTVHVTARRITRDDLSRPWISPIGKPLHDLSAVVLDRHLQPVPLDVPGELYVGGQGVARGYLNRPDLAAERFVPDPHSALPGARLYRTGDRVRRRHDGELEYLGRTDHQIKVRGFRIETGEIEAALSQCRAVRESVVVGRTDDEGDTQIVAYVVCLPEASFSTDQIRQWLSERLPEYMVPAVFVFLDRLPRTSGGKVDHQALPPPRRERPDLEGEYVAPKDVLEQRIAMLWARVLQLETVGVRDNFFSLGGNSLRLAQLHGLLHDEMALDVSMVTLFKFPTIRALGEHLQANSPRPTGVQLGQTRASARQQSRRQQRGGQRRPRGAGHDDSEHRPH
jgi:hypothetical protein